MGFVSDLMLPSKSENNSQETESVFYVCKKDGQQLVQKGEAETWNPAQPGQSLCLVSLLVMYWEGWGEVCFLGDWFP